jgi:hypothetical protein
MLLYIHIPFCDSKCAYCSFNSYVDSFHLRQTYMEALQQQLRHELLHFAAGPRSIETVFIGGGTPSTISPELYAPIFELLDRYLHPQAEITVEANPNDACGFTAVDHISGSGVDTRDFALRRLTYELDDGNGGTAQAIVTLTVTPVNDAPTLAISEPLELDEGGLAALSDEQIAADSRLLDDRGEDRRVAAIVRLDAYKPRPVGFGQVLEACSGRNAADLIAGSRIVYT